MKKQAKKTRLPVRCYDTGKKDNDRYTVVYTEPNQCNYPDGTKSKIFFIYVGMNAIPFSPNAGIAQHGETDSIPPDSGSGFGKRIPFSKLPPDCQKVVLQDLKSEE